MQPCDGCSLDAAHSKCMMSHWHASQEFLRCHRVKCSTEVNLRGLSIVTLKKSRKTTIEVKSQGSGCTSQKQRIIEATSEQDICT